MSTREPQQPENQRRCFRALVPRALPAFVEVVLRGGRVSLPINELSVESDGHSGGLRLGPVGSLAARLQPYGPTDLLALQIFLPDEPALPADGVLLRWEGEPSRPVIQYRLRDRRGEERLRRFWAACQRHFLHQVP